MVIIGYQGIGKTTVAGKNMCIDLESGNFWVKGKRIEGWEKIYCNIAEHLSNQGYTVLMSSHKVVRNELAFRGTDFVVIAPCLELKDSWINRLQERYNKSGLDKDFKALMNAKDCYEENIIDLSREGKVKLINSIDYDLEEIINELREQSAT
jgi:hypothetical protein